MKRISIVTFLTCILLTLTVNSWAMQASYYSVKSLKRDGQWRLTKGRCSDGSQFSDTKKTCATWLYKKGTMLKIRNKENGKEVICKVTDRINRRFTYKRIDLSKSAFMEIAGGEQGLKKELLPITVEVVR